MPVPGGLPLSHPDGPPAPSSPAPSPTPLGPPPPSLPQPGPPRPAAALPDQPPAAAARPGRWRFAGLAYALAVLIIGTNLPTPLYAVYERVFRLSPAGITVLVAGYAGAVVLSLLLCGPLSDAVGYRPVLTAGLAAAAAGSALLAAASGPGWLLAGRIVQGLAVGAASGALTAGLVLTEPAGRRDRASLFAAVTTTAAVGAGPVLAGALAGFAPAPRVTCYLAEIGLLAPAVAAAAALPRGLGATGRRWRPRRPRLPPGRGRDFAVPALVGFLGWAVAYVVLALVPSYAAAAAGRGNLLVDGSAAGSLLLFAAAAQLLLRGRDAGWAMRRGLALLIAGLAGLIAAGALGSVPLLFATIAVAGAGQGLGFAGAVRRVNDLAPPAGRAGTVSLFYVITYAGAGLATIGVGLLATTMPLTRAVQLSAAAFAVCAAAVLAVAGRPLPR